MYKDLILSRKSVRTFRPAQIDSMTYDEIYKVLDEINRKYENVMFKLFNANEFNLSSNVTQDETLYIVGKVKKVDNFEVLFGYCINCIMLELTRLNLSSVFMAGTIDRKRFDDLFSFGDIMPGVLAVGYKANYQTIKERILCRFLHSEKKLGLSDCVMNTSLKPYVFKNNQLKDILETSLNYASARNYCPVRIIIDNNKAHLFLKHNKALSSELGDIQKVDLGIYLYNIEVLLEESNFLFSEEHYNVSDIDSLNYVMTIQLKGDSLF